VPKESGLSPKFFSFAMSQPQIYLLKMPSAVMTGNTFKIQAEQNLGGVDRDLVPRIFGCYLVTRRIVHMEFCEKVGWSRKPIGASAGSQHFLDHRVVGNIQAHASPNVVVEDIATWRSNVAPIVSKKVVE